MRPIFRSSFWAASLPFGAALCLLLTGSQWALAQTRADSIRTDGISAGVDLARLGLQLAGNSNGFFETQVGANLGANWAIVEFGNRTYKRNLTSYDYQASGNWVRLGYERNLFKRGDDVMALGGRYGFANFQHQASQIVITDSYYGSRLVYTRPEESASARWIEGTATLKMRVVAQLYLGVGIRFRYLLGTKYEQLTPLHVPGYGLATGNLSTSFNYWLAYKLPWRRYTFYQDKKKK